MSETIIKVENLSKQYRLGEVGTGTISHDLNRWWAKVRGKEDPFSRIGETNDRTKRGNSDYVWALRDINFEVKQGEVLGIIGRNGAGKSTLLKLLSKVTSPTTGSIKMKGRVASLLEVGTGFHPELTGRENVFLNGAILGMTKNEIERKFDEIVDFAGVERYIDTPVKRYSSGMYVRLAFAVAAHLEPEILIVDEVLAVGDAEFQKKCLGKMDEVSHKEGRTILFVSHNMAAVSSLTNRCILIKNGLTVSSGNTESVINDYLASKRASEGAYEKDPNEVLPSITRVELHTSEENAIQANGRPLMIEFDINTPVDMEGLDLSFQIFNHHEEAIVHMWVSDNDMPLCRKKGKYTVRCTVPSIKLYIGNYYLKVHLSDVKAKLPIEKIDKICAFEVVILGETMEWGWNPDTCTYLESGKWEVDQIN